MHYIICEKKGVEIKVPDFHQAREQFGNVCRQYPDRLVEWFKMDGSKCCYITMQAEM